MVLHVSTEGDAPCSLEDVMVFFSGASRIPPLGFHPSPTLEFVHDTGAKLATSSTCDLVLRIPTCFGADEFSEFTEWMAMSVLGNDGFGGV